MKFTIQKNQLNIPPELLLKKSGYASIYDRRTGKTSFARRLARDFYPRFHVYVEKNNEKIIFNLHLDQKKPSYQGQKAHSAEYGGELIENEIKRLKGLITQIKTNKNTRKINLREKKKSFWQRLLGN